MNDHILVLGWTDKTLFLLQQLMVVLANEHERAQQRRKQASLLGRLFFWGTPAKPTIVTLGNHPRIDMIQVAQSPSRSFNSLFFFPFWKKKITRWHPLLLPEKCM